MIGHIMLLLLYVIVAVSTYVIAGAEDAPEGVKESGVVGKTILSMLWLPIMVFTIIDMAIGNRS